MNVNLRAARNLVNTVYATREQQRSAMLTLERTIEREDRALRRLTTAGDTLPGLLAVAIIATELLAAWLLKGSTLLSPDGGLLPLVALVFVGVPVIVSLLTGEVITRRVEAADVRVEHLMAKRESLRALILRLNVTVKESEQELADRERAAA